MREQKFLVVVVVLANSESKRKRSKLTFQGSRVVLHGVRLREELLTNHPPHIFIGIIKPGTMRCSRLSATFRLLQLYTGTLFPTTYNPRLP